MNLAGQEKEKEYRTRFPARRAPEEPVAEEETFFYFFCVGSWEELAYGPTDNKDPLDMLFFLGQVRGVAFLALLLSTFVRFIVCSYGLEGGDEGVSPISFSFFVL